MEIQNIIRKDKKIILECDREELETIGYMFEYHHSKGNFLLNGKDTEIREKIKKYLEETNPNSIRSWLKKV